jgi:hypothetical protein
MSRVLALTSFRAIEIAPVYFPTAYVGNFHWNSSFRGLLFSFVGWNDEAMMIEGEFEGLENEARNLTTMVKIETEDESVCSTVLQVMLLKRKEYCDVNLSDCLIVPQ